MHPLDAAILEAFRRDPSRAFATAELVRAIYPEEYARLSERIKSGERRTVRKGYNEKARLHRQLLYHVNKLVDRGLLEVAGLRGKGEKQFRLRLDEGELVIQEKGHRIVITKPGSMATPVDGDEREGIVRKFRPETWLSKHDAIMLDCLAHEHEEELLRRLRQALPAVSDTVALDRMESILGRLRPEQRAPLLARIGQDARDYDVAISLLFHLPGLEDPRCVLEALREALGLLPPQVSVILHTTPRTMARNEALFLDLLRLFAEQKRKLTLKNSAIAPLPIFFGKAGTYSFTAEDWEEYKANARGSVDACLIGQTSLAVDIEKYLATGGTISGLRDLAERAANAFFEAEEQRRRHFGQRPLLPLNGADAAKEFQKPGRNYLRFWNPDWEEAATTPMLELLESVKERLAEFGAMQETIYKSCGLPIRFRVAISTSFARFDQDFFSERRYQKTAVASVKELQTARTKAYLRVRERLFRLCENADRLRFFIARNTPPEESLRIARYLLSAYALPTITLDFQGKAGELKLTTFLEG